MEPTLSIAAKMVQDHAKIAEVLERLEGAKDGGEQAVKMNYNKFKWELERHFMTEEKAIFVDIEPFGEPYKLLQAVLNDHEVIRELVERLGNEIEAGTWDIAELKAKLLKHRDMEDKLFYPLLDEHFDEEQKRAVIRRVDSPI